MQNFCSEEGSMSSVKSLMSPSPQQTTHRMEPSGEMRMEANFRERGGGEGNKRL